MQSLTRQQKRSLLDLARNAIASRLGCTLTGAEQQWGRLNQPAACFVTLKLKGRLRGCVGTLQPRFPLWQEVQRMAAAAAFEDSRFTPLTPEEWPEVKLSIAILTPSEPMVVGCETELLQLLRPEVDGLTLDFGRHHATFLPAVWDTLPEPQEFVGQLKCKAGLSQNFWSKEIHWFRYQSNSFSETDCELL